jgi:hypothetical protein
MKIQGWIRVAKRALASGVFGTGALVADLGMTSLGDGIMRLSVRIDSGTWPEKAKKFEDDDAFF